MEQFTEKIRDAGVPLSRTVIVEGWFENTCVAETANKHAIRKAAIVWLDADLYSSTKSALSFITPFLQDGTILIFDDWYSFKGSPYFGVQKAFYEWSKSDSLENSFIFHEYHKEGWKRISFIASKISNRESCTQKLHV
jgi:O-methyltransferase